MSKPATAACGERGSCVRSEPRIEGVSIEVTAAETLASEAAAARLVDSAFDVLVRHGRLAVTVAGLRDRDDARDLLVRLCGLLDSAVAEAGRGPDAIEILLDAATMDPVEAWQGRCEALGAGPLYLHCDAELMSTRGERARGMRFWSQLWQLRGGFVRAAYAPLVRSACPLLCADPAMAIQPANGLQVPAGSAWVSAPLYLPDFLDGRGQVQLDALERSLERVVDAADAVFDRAEWATAAARHDAWFNRRLAVSLRGIGDFVARRGRDPRSLACLDELSELCAWCRAVLHARSRTLASGRDVLPALRDGDPQRWLPSASVRDDWRERWQQAVARHAVRNRNLFALSPWAVLPSAGHAHAGYLDLLPLLAHADAMAFAGQPDLSRWNLNDFINLHQRSHAVFERRNARGEFAEQA